MPIVQKPQTSFSVGGSSGSFGVILASAFSSVLVLLSPGLSLAKTTRATTRTLNDPSPTVARKDLSGIFSPFSPSEDRSRVVPSVQHPADHADQLVIAEPSKISETEKPSALNSTETKAVNKLSDALEGTEISAELNEIDKITYDEMTLKANHEQQALNKEIKELDSRISKSRRAAERAKNTALLAQKRLMLSQTQLQGKQKILAAAEAKQLKLEKLNTNLKASAGKIQDRHVQLLKEIREANAAALKLSADNAALERQIAQHRKLVATQLKQRERLRRKSAEAQRRHHRLERLASKSN